ncbi:hypothetical protein HPB48_003950 [Haemaphysalis longicornis]|uniref:Uncharacterized protein n=1 Tax=Haemaphysalis longicornis TaxID=44386 RepID=A0A9J6GF46_HAELO|nr:hypothetical protein HPB48_003950 [Haemaphysalis longicornis]
MCKQLSGPYGSGGRWNLLKLLIGETQTKSNQQILFGSILHQQREKEITDGDILKDLANTHTYLPLGNKWRRDYPECTGKPNPRLDEPILELEGLEAL